MKKKYEALAISFLFVNLIYSHGVIHLQPSIGDEIVGMLYNLFHLFEYNTVIAPFWVECLLFSYWHGWFFCDGYMWYSFT